MSGRMIKNSAHTGANGRKQIGRRKVMITSSQAPEGMVPQRFKNVLCPWQSFTDVRVQIKSLHKLVHFCRTKEKMSEDQIDQLLNVNDPYRWEGWNK